MTNMTNKIKTLQSIRIWVYMLTSMLTTITAWGQAGGEKATNELIRLGFENVQAQLLSDEILNRKEAILAE